MVNQYPPWPSHKDAAFINAWNADVSNEEIMKRFNITRSRLYFHKKRLGLPRRYVSDIRIPAAVQAKPLENGRWVNDRGIQRWVAHV